MPRRRVIYIRNPREGSHFRTLSGSGSSNRPPRPPQQQPQNSWLPPTDDPIPSQYGYHGTGTTDPNWSIGGSQTYAPFPYGWGQPGWGNGLAPFTNGFTPFVEDVYALRWSQGSIWTALLDIAQGIDPYTGQYQPSWGAPGTLSPFVNPATGETIRFPGEYRIGGVPRAALERARNFKPRKRR